MRLARSASSTVYAVVMVPSHKPTKSITGSRSEAEKLDFGG